MNFTIELPQIQTKPLNKNERRWEVQREIFTLLEQEDLKPLNWKRYVSFLKKYKLDHYKLGFDECKKRWRQCSRNKADADVREIKKISKMTFGFFTSHLDEAALWFTLSVCRDKLNRNESPTCYILGFVKHEKT